MPCHLVCFTTLILSRARDWVAETLEWLATEVLAGQDRAPGAGGRMGPGAFAAAGDRQADVCAFLGADAQASPEQVQKLKSELVDTVRVSCTWACLLGGGTRPEPHLHACWWWKYVYST